MDINNKRYILTTLLLTAMAVGVVSVLNYVVDPYGQNNQFSFERINASKIVLDERIEKFRGIEANEYEAYILGASSNTIMDPDIITQVTSLTAYNAAFAAATIDEIDAFVGHLVDNKKPKLIIVGLNSYMFGQVFRSNGNMPDQLDASQDRPVYASLKQFQDTVKTVQFNRNLVELSGAEKRVSQEYSKKGMRYYGDYIRHQDDDLFIEDNTASIINAEKTWHDSTVSEQRLQSFRRIVAMCADNDVRLVVLMNPMSHLVLEHEKFSGYRSYLNLLSTLAVEHQVLDFNTFGDLNTDLSSFIDNLHYNYRIADELMRIALTRECGGVAEEQFCIDGSNVDSHVLKMEKLVEID